MAEYKEYRKKGTTEMRPYIPGESMLDVSINSQDTLEEGGMVARDKTNHKDQWYISKLYFKDNYEEA